MQFALLRCHGRRSIGFGRPWAPFHKHAFRRFAGKDTITVDSSPSKVFLEVNLQASVHRRLVLLTLLSVRPAWKLCTFPCGLSCMLRCVTQGEGVKTWPTWGCEASVFPWSYSENEKAYILEGEVVVTPDGKHIHPISSCSLLPLQFNPLHDPRSVVPQTEPRSRSRQETFARSPKA